MLGRRCRRSKATARAGLALLLVAAAGYVPAAPSVPRLPPSVVVAEADLERARQAHAELLARTPVYEDARLAAAVDDVGRRVAAAAPPVNVRFRFDVLDSEGLFACSFAGGQVVISRGLLVQLATRDELAAILAHEVAHVVGLHQARQVEQFRRALELQVKLGERFQSDQARDTLGALTAARLRGYSREQELEADGWGEQLLREAGYRPGSSARVLRLLEGQERFEAAAGPRLWQLPDETVAVRGGSGVFATHPSVAARLVEAERSLAPAQATVVDETFLGLLDGVVYGISPRYGIRRGDTFIASPGTVAWSVPAGWYVFGSDGAVVMASPDNAAMLRLSLAEGAADAPARLTAMSGGGLPQTAIAGDHVRVLASVPAPGAGRVVRLWAVADLGSAQVEVDGRAATDGDWARYDDAVRGILRSIRASVAVERTWEPVRIAIIDGGAPAAPPGIGLRPGELEQLNRTASGELARWVKVLR